MSGAAAKMVAVDPATPDFDLDAFRASQREETGEAPFTFRWKGTLYQIPSREQWPVEVPGLMNEGQVTKALAALVPGLDMGGMVLGDVNAILTAAARAFGVETPGN